MEQFWNSYCHSHRHLFSILSSQISYKISFSLQSLVLYHLKNLVISEGLGIKIVLLMKDAVIKLV